MHSVLKSFLVSLVCIYFPIAYATGTGVVVSDAWIPERPPVSPNMAGYFKLKNNTDRTITLAGVSSPSFAMAEMHRTETSDGVAKMVRQDNIDVPPGESLVFEPGSYHLMLMRPTKPLTDGDTVPIQLLLVQGQIVNLDAKVVRPIF